MTRSRTFVAAALVAAAGAAAGLAGRSSPAGAGHLRPAAALTDREILEADIAFFAERARRDPRGAANLAQLAGLYLQRARESGDVEDLRRAEAAARQSMARRGWRNQKAQLVLASSLLAQHRFLEAKQATERLVLLDPERASFRALLGEIQLELGDYEAARVTFGGLSGDADNLAVAPRLARWAEIEGRVSRAHALLLAASREAARRADLPREQVAWFELRLADLALRHGRLAEARRVAEAALAKAPDDPRLLGLMARLAAARGEWREALSYARAAESGGADLATLALAGDALARLGDSASAAAYWDMVERAHAANPEPYARQWTAFRLDRGLRLDETRRVLEAEILDRRDVLGWHLLARARLLTGDLAGAREASREALRLGTPDAGFEYHAGIIALASRDTAAAVAHLSRALAMNPAFHHLTAGTARRLLARLRFSTYSSSFSGCRTRIRMAASGTTRYFLPSKVISTAALRKNRA